MRVLGAMAMVLLLSGCGLFSGGDKESEVLQPAPLPQIEETIEIARIWSFQAGAEFADKFLRLSPAVDGERLYVAGADGRVTALDASSGEVAWQVDLDEPISAGAGKGEGLVLLGTPEGEVVALDGRDGQPLWRHRVSSEVLTPPAVEAGIVVVRTVDGRLYGLSSASGERQWEIRREVPSLSLRGVGAPLLRDSVAIVGFADGKLVAVDLRSGRILWDLGIARPTGRNEVERMIDIDAAPLLVGSVLYAATFQGRVMAVSLGSRRILWARDTSSYTGLGADSDNLYVADASGRVRAYDRLTGDELWTQEQLLNRRLSGAQAIGDHVVVGDFEGYLHLLRRRDGQLVGRRRVGESWFSVPPLVEGNVIYTMTADGTLSALSLSDESG